VDVEDRDVVAPDHTVTGDRDLAVVLESGVGGQIYERPPAGSSMTGVS